MLAQLGSEEQALKEFETIARRAPGSVSADGLPRSMQHGCEGPLEPSQVDMRAAMAALYWAQGRDREAEDTWNFACENITTGCLKYQDEDWLGRIRRWPPRMVARMMDFVKLRRAAGQP